MSERSGSTSLPKAGLLTTPGAGPAEALPPGPPAEPEPNIAAEAAPGSPAAPYATTPVTVRPRPRGARRGPLTVMGPWAPVAGGLLGLLLGAGAVVLLAGTAVTFGERLSLVLLVVGLGLLGTSGTLLADEVALLRRAVREASVRPRVADATASLLTGLTPARLLLVVSGFVLFLAAYVAR